MHKLHFSRKTAWITAIAAVVTAVAVTIGTATFYVNDYYRADTQAIEAFAATNSTLPVVEGENTLSIAPPNASKGLIFYPGGKVDPDAYLPLMQACASEGILCVVAEMPFRLAVLDIHAADDIRDAHPEIGEWYIGGHSLGGSMAAAHIAARVDDYEGLILLAAYSTADLSNTDLKVLSVYGSEDNVLNLDSYHSYADNLPLNTYEEIIDGGCHAYFGMYGEQDGDGVAAITADEQIAQTAALIADFIA